MKKSCYNCYYYSSGYWCHKDAEFECMNNTTIEEITEFKLWRKTNIFRKLYLYLYDRYYDWRNKRIIKKN